MEESRLKWFLTRMQGKIVTEKLNNKSFKMWQSSNIWERQ
jgi:hypothetical protein